MYSIWLSLKENANCSGKATDGRREEKVANKYRNHEVGRLKSGRENPMDDVIFRRNYTTERFYELNIRDPSRNVIEIIFRTASMRRSKHARKIERVLRVKNSIETLRRFEEYREIVKKSAHGQYAKHPRSAVDGNELLLFYSTTMSCCFRKRNKVSVLCQDAKCGVCRIIHSGFDIEDTKRDGIRLSASSETLSDNTVAIAKGKNMKSAVVVCRVIAGRAVNMVEGGSEEGFDSVSGGRLCSKMDHLFVRNPSAVLPCFVIVCA